MAQLRSRFDAWASRPWKLGETAHSALFAASCLLIEEGYEEEQIRSILRTGADQIQDRRITDREIDSAVRGAFNRDPSEQSNTRWPDFNPYLYAEVSSCFSLEELRFASDCQLYSSDDYIEALFPGDPLLCVGATAYAFETRSRRLWNGFLGSMPYLVPNPMSEAWGTTVEGRSSMHTLSNTGPRKYLVVEFDYGSLDEQAAVLWHLSKSRPLLLAVYSGGKSLHGWFSAPEAQEHLNHSFFASAAALGADTRMWLKSQFTRVPDGLNRQTQKRQQVQFFNPKALIQCHEKI